MRYDLTLKELFHNQPRRLLKLLTGCGGGRPLTVEYPEVRQRRPDLVLELDDGRIYHLEIQSGPDPEMPWRMLEYYTLIRRTHGRIPQQQILYVGEPPARLMDRIEEAPLQFPIRSSISAASIAGSCWPAPRSKTTCLRCCAA